MAIKERKQITGTEAQIKGYAGHNGVLAYATDTKHLHVLSGTAGTTTKIANVSDIPAPVDISGKADTSYVNTELGKKADKTYVDTELAKKQSKGDYATTTALNDGLAGKANKMHTHAMADVDGLQTTLNTINGKIPTKTSQITNDSGFLTTHPNISVAAETLSAGSVATVTKSGTDAAPVFTFGIPKGADGAKGDKGDPGPQGPEGPQGPAGSSAPTPNAYVTETYRNGKIFYRVWSNGFIEQWGFGGGKEILTVTLPKPYSDIQYNVYVTSTSDLVASVGRVDVTTTSFKVDTNSNTNKIYWYTSGF